MIQTNIRINIRIKNIRIFKYIRHTLVQMDRVLLIVPLPKFDLCDQVAILAMEAEEENLSEEKKLSLGQEVR